MPPQGGDTSFIIQSTLTSLHTLASKTKESTSGSNLKQTASGSRQRKDAGSPVKRDTSGSNLSDRQIGPDFVTRGEGNELKDVFAKLQKKTAAEEVQMRLAHPAGESGEPELTETVSKASTKGKDKDSTRY